MSTELLQAVRDRIRGLLVGELFLSPEDGKGLVEPSIYIRTAPPKRMDRDNIHNVPGIIIFRLRSDIGVCNAGTTFGVLWCLHTPVDDTAYPEDAYLLAEQQVDRADAAMKEFLTESRVIGNGWKINNFESYYGNETGDQPTNESWISYQITAQQR